MSEGTDLARSVLLVMVWGMPGEGPEPGNWARRQVTVAQVCFETGAMEPWRFGWLWLWDDVCGFTKLQSNLVFFLVL